MKAETKHSLALNMIAIGVVALLLGGIAAVTSITNGKTTGAVWGVTSVLIGAWLVWRAVRIRNAAVGAGSRVHLEGEGNSHTSHTKAAKPSFLKDRRPGQ